MFMGTPDIAAACLKTLIASGEDVVAVVTGEDKPRGRGNVMTPTPVKRVAQENNIAVYTPKTLRDGAFDATLAEVNPDVIAVVAYGKILPASVINYPKHGCVNLHVSLLPKYRGAAPMQRAIIAGETETGVTVMQMDEGLDTGDILFTERFPIAENDNFETVHDALGKAGAEALLETLAALRAGTLRATVQDEALATYAAKITKEDCLIDFSAPASAVHDRIRALSPVPLAFTHTPDGKLLKILESRLTGAKTDAAPGTVLSLDGCIDVACGEGSVLSLLRVLPEGKGRMSAADYIRGRRIAKGDILN
jgi:methionyl-tRNA formyltransferase